MIQWNFKMKTLFSKTLKVLSEQTMQHITDKGDSGEDCPVHPYATFWKTPLASNQNGIVIKYFVEIVVIYYHRSGNKNICQGVRKFGIIDKWKICCVWDNSQDLSNFKESLRQGMLFDTKTWSCHWKGVFVPMFWQWIFAEDMKALKSKHPICGTFFVLCMG